MVLSKSATLGMKIVGYIFTVGEAIAPALFTFPRIVREDSNGPNWPFAYALMWLSSVFQLSYAIRKLDKAGIVVYAIVFLLTAAYCVTYVIYCTGKGRALGCSMLVVAMFFLAFLIAVELTIVKGTEVEKRDTLQDLMMLVLTVLINLSPAMEVIEAFRTHQVGGVDILLSLAFLGNAIIATISACSPFKTFPALCGIAGIVITGGECYVWLRCHMHGHHVAQHGHPIDRLIELIAGAQP